MYHPTPTLRKCSSNLDANASRDQNVLVPTKVNQYQDPITNEYFQEPFPRHQSSRWTAQPILQWIESLISATERYDQQGMILVDGIRLSEPSPPPPPCTLTQKQPPPTTQMKDPMIQQMDLWNFNSGERLSGENPNWDLSYIDRQDPFAWPSTRQIYNLAAQFESLVNSPTSQMRLSDSELDDLIISYHLLQARVEFTFGRVISQEYDQRFLLPSHRVDDGAVITPMAPDFAQGEGRHLLNALYEQTIQKMECLVRDIQTGGQRHESQFSANKGGQPVFPIREPSSKVFWNYKSTTPSIPKQEFSKYMTDWLRQNWTNPYPDDEGLRAMANDCGTTTKVISNWLINARTRKWRPAIEKAIEANRPSQFLLEDSLNIFDEKPLRDLGRTASDSFVLRQQSHPFPLSTPEHHPLAAMCNAIDMDDDCDVMNYVEQDANEEDYFEHAPNKRHKSDY